MDEDKREMKIPDRFLAQQCLRQMHNLIDIVLTRKCMALMNEEFSEYERKVIVAQNAVRRFLAHTQFQKLKKERDVYICNVIIVQSCIRRFLAMVSANKVRKQHAEDIKKIVIVQSHIRGYLARMRLLHEAQEQIAELEEICAETSSSSDSLSSLSQSISQLTIRSDRTFTVAATTTPELLKIMRSVRAEIEKMKLHNASRQSTLERLQNLKEARRSRAAVTIQRYWRGYSVRKEFKEEIKEMKNTMEVYMENAQNVDTSFDVKNETQSATSRLLEYTDMLFANTLYKNKVAAVCIYRLLSLSSILCKYFVENCDGLAVVLDRMSQMDRSPGEEEIITCLTAVIQRIIDSTTEPTVKAAILEHATTIFKILFHASYALYNNEEVVRMCAVALVGLKKACGDITYKSASYYISQADKRYSKLPATDLKKMSLELLKEAFIY